MSACVCGETVIVSDLASHVGVNEDTDCIRLLVEE